VRRALRSVFRRIYISLAARQKQTVTPLENFSDFLGIAIKWHAHRLASGLLDGTLILNDCALGVLSIVRVRHGDGDARHQLILSIPAKVFDCR